MDIIGDVINKGVPISTPISIRCGDLLNISDNPKELRANISNEFDKYLQFLNENYKKADFEIFLTMSVCINPETLEKKLIFSPEGLITSILYNLNYKNICNDSVIETTTMNFELSDLYPQIEKLKKINNDQKLKKEFPALYNCYKGMIETRRQIEVLKRKKGIKQNASPEKVYLAVDDELKQKGLFINFGNFLKIYNLDIIQYCKDIAVSFENIINHLPEIEKYLEENSFTLNAVGISKEKLELYFAYRFLKEIEIEHYEDKQDFVYHVANYFRENTSRKNSDYPKITIDAVTENKMGLDIKDVDGREITPKSLYQDFTELLLKNPELKPINFSDVNFSGMSLEEVNDFVADYLKTYTANWEIIPKGKYDETAYSIFKKSNHSEVDYEKLKQLFMEKVMFYNEQDPYMCVEGKKTFDGYIGYIFSNGIVILDKFYENVEKGRVSKGDAIYYMKIEDFYRLSHYPKRELMKMPEVGRVIHRGDWMETIKKIISQTGDGMNTTKETNKLMQKKYIKVDNKG